MCRPKSLLVFYCNYVCTVSEIFSVKNGVILKSMLGVVQDHSKWYHSRAWVQQFPVVFHSILLLYVEFHLYPTVGTVLIHSAKPELT